VPRQRASQAHAAFARVGTAPVPAGPDDDAPAVPASDEVFGNAGFPASEKESKNAGRKESEADGGKAGVKAGDAAAGHRPGRRLGRPRGPARIPLTVRILRRTDERLTAAVEATGHSPQYIVDEALARYLDSLGL